MAALDARGKLLFISGLPRDARGGSMGAGASTQQVRSQVEGLGAAYAVYGQAIEDNGIDGDIVQELASEPSIAFDQTFADLHVTNTLHRRKLLQAVRSEYGLDRRRSGSSLGSVDEAPAVAVAEEARARV